MFFLWKLNDQVNQINTNNQLYAIKVNKLIELILNLLKFCFSLIDKPFIEDDDFEKIKQEWE